MDLSELKIRRTIAADLAPNIAANCVRWRDGLAPEIRNAAENRLKAYTSALDKILPEHHGVDVYRIAQDVRNSFANLEVPTSYAKQEEEATRRLIRDIDLAFDLSVAVAPEEDAEHPRLREVARLLAEAYHDRHIMLTSNGKHRMAGRVEGLMKALVALTLADDDPRAAEAAEIDFREALTLEYFRIGGDIPRLTDSIITTLTVKHRHQS